MRIFLCSFLLVFAWQTASLAQQSDSPTRQRKITFAEVLRREDVNKDGRVPKAEFKGPAKLFPRLDRNGDQVLTKEDFEPSENESRRDRGGRVPDGVEVHRDLVFGTGGGRELKMHLAVPKQKPTEPMPVYVWIHGGGWQGGTKEQGMGQILPLAQSGFVGATIEYRLTGEAIFPAQIEDCKCAIRFLRAHAKKYHIDSDRIAVGGSSAGGHLAALVGTSGSQSQLEGSGGWSDQSSEVQAVVDLYGPTDLIQFATTPGYESHARSNSPESKLLGGDVLELKDKAKQVNPITYVDKGDPPFLIIHGSKDRTVPPNQSESMHEALQKVRVKSRLHVIAGAGHGGPEFGTPEIREMKKNFLLKTLSPK